MSDTVVHGLVYPDGLLESLPAIGVNGANNDDNAPIRLLSASQFAELHLQHTLSHPPDNVIFPFLHGLEGDNHAQNTFFASSSGAAPTHATSSGGNGGACTINNSHSAFNYPFQHQHKLIPRIPKYRGLVWVVCEDDLEKAGDGVTLRVLRRKPFDGANPTALDVPSSSSSEEEDNVVEEETSDEYEDDFDEDEELMVMGDERLHGRGIIADIDVDADADADADVEDLESVLASPILSSPVPMQVDSVHVRVAGVDSSVGSESESVCLTEENGIADLPTNLKGDMNYEGKHMHPVSHRPAVSVIAPPMPHGHTHPTHHHPLPITTSFPAHDSSKVDNENSPDNTVSASSSFASSSSLATPSSSEEGETPLSSVFSGDGDAEDKSTPQPTDAPSPRSQSFFAQRDRTPPRSRSPPPNAHHRTPSTPKTPHPAPKLNARVCKDPSRPPLLTSTFRPRELLKKHKRKSTTLSNEEKEHVKAGLVSAGLKHHPFSPPPSPKPEDATTGFLAQQMAGDEQFSAAPKVSGASQAKERVKEEESWEFCPTKVPDGISLRNFGIQVPIYATLSDVVVYSPHGATPAALTLARRFRAAIKAKRFERMRRAGINIDLLLSDDAEDEVDSQESSPTQAHHSHHHHGQISIPAASRDDLKTQAREAAAAFVEYQVFVLSAEEDEMRREMPHMMMKMYRDGDAGMNGEYSLSPDALEKSDQYGPHGRKGEHRLDVGTRHEAGAFIESGAHTDGPDGHIIELGAVEDAEKAAKEREKARDLGMDMVVDMDVDVNFEMDVDRPSSRQMVEDFKDTHYDSPNTVDFTLREKEEMRDLTKASEIITLYPDSRPPSSTLARTSSPARTASNRHGASLGHSLTSKSNPRSNPQVGQVFLGNSGDVPLAPDVPTQFRHAASVPRGSDDGVTTRGDLNLLTRHLRGVEGLAKEYGVDDETDSTDSDGLPDFHDLPHDDPFNYLSTNDPEKGFGFDICIECHDLAPFPTPTHMRVAEDHLGSLDVMWKERWEKAWIAREEMKVKEGTSTRVAPPPPAPPRPPPHANAVIHLPCPSSPNNSQSTLVALIPVIRFLEKWIKLVTPPPPSTRPNTPPELKNLMMIGNVDPKRNMAGAGSSGSSTSANPGSSTGTGSRRWSSVTSLMPSLLPPSFPSFNGLGLGGKDQPSSAGTNDNNPPPHPPPNAPLPPHPARSRSFTSPSAQHPPHLAPSPVQARTRPLKILLYSSDGYTESSVPALCLLMAIDNLGLPEAYLELQVAKRRSFFVYQGDLGVLRRVESRLREEREREKERERERQAASGTYPGAGSINANGKRTAPTPAPVSPAPATRAGGVYWSGVTNNNSGGPSSNRPPTGSSGSFMGRPAAKSVSFARPPPAPAATLPAISSETSTGSGSLPSQTIVPHKPAFATSGHIQHASDPASPDLLQQQTQSSAVATTPGTGLKGRQRAMTSPWLPSLFGGDHQSWFNDPRFDGSFPSRVLPFLYLGNLNHASNVYMLHALGITHVVSVGECALVPPPNHMAPHNAGPSVRVGGGHKGPGSHGSLWIEEREGRIKVMDIKGVCDDGIDTLEPQLEPICEWIDQARREGGQVLVHCRVGVSRSATVTIAYVMKYLNIPLVDAYLIVRSRRLSVLIQPNMRLLYNLCGWEIKLARERANGDKHKLKKELSRTLAWPYLAKEVHALNEKYLH